MAPRTDDHIHVRADNGSVPAITHVPLACSWYHHLSRRRLFDFPTASGRCLGTSAYLNTVSYAVVHRFSRKADFKLDLPLLSKHSDLARNVGELDMSAITLSFDSHIIWTLKGLTEDVVKWLNDTSISSTSKVGMLSSPKLQALIEPFIGSRICSDFQTMLYAQSVAYTGTPAETIRIYSASEVEQLVQLAAISGHSLILQLDRTLTPATLATYSQDGLRALFLILFGTILAVGYATPVGTSPMFPQEVVSNWPYA
jgi:hypothetical protein